MKSNNSGISTGKNSLLKALLGFAAIMGVICLAAFDPINLANNSVSFIEFATDANSDLLLSEVVSS